MNWFSVRLLFESEVTDDQKVGPLCEESIRLVMAVDEESAMGRAVEVGRRAEHRYTNAEGRDVNWRFVDVLEVQDLCEEELLDGVEVYSYLFHKGEK